MADLKRPSRDIRIAHLSSLSTVSASTALLSACFGDDSSPAPAPAPAPAPVAVTCDNSMIAAFKPDANTTITVVKAFKKGDAGPVADRKVETCTL